ncbi:hypothetical protein FQN53_009452 [Emmonsiellopsis sp. PD_33]|nr:hypothetical protein FQN53_009452 [Emmonsiellopsis sp. PD_33]
MPVARSLLYGQITYSEAQKKETNILQELTYASLAASFKARIESKSETIKAIVAHHLYLNRSCCIDIAHPSEWLNGSFNLCVPVSVRTPRDSVRVLMRFPLPYKTAETIHPGNGDEKTRCEAGTYAWIAQECPDIPIASLWGFGLSTSGPFVPTLTDLHPSNLFVDDDWHIKKLLDLEWMCIRPVEMQHPPYWLTNQAVDRIDEVEYSKLGNEFIDILEEEERQMTKESTLPEEVTNGLTYAELLRRLWRQGTFWYCFGLDSPTGLHHIFYNRTKPRYQVPDKDSFDDGFYIVAPTFWTTRAWDFMFSKSKDKAKYDDELRKAFRMPSP